MIIISSILVKILSLGQSRAVTIFPFIFLRTRVIRKWARLVMHEKIHLEQQREFTELGVLIGVLVAIITSFQLLWLVPAGFLYFYLWYLIEYLIKRIKGYPHHQACGMLSFEKEAGQNANNSLYLRNKKYFSFIKYIRL